MTKIPKISVIMSVFNCEKFIQQAIESVLNQSFKNFELIIIDDKSTDNTLQIIERFKKHDSRIVLIKNKINLGPAKSRNIGILTSKGEYIAILDADDISLKNRFEKQYTFLEQNQDIFLVCCNNYIINENSQIVSTFKVNKKFGVLLPTKNQIFHSTIMFRNDKNTFYREKFIYSHDYDLYLCIKSRNLKIRCLNDILVKYRINSSAISFTNSSKQELFSQKAREFYSQRINFGKDNYDNFDPQKIMTLNPLISTNKHVIESEIKSQFKLNNFKTVRKYCKKYFKLFGYFNIFFVYYLFTFTNKKIINLVRNCSNFIKYSYNLIQK